MSVRLKEKVALVTGAAYGIGRAIVHELAREGADIGIADIDIEEGRRAADEIRSMGRRSVAVEVDVRKSQEVNYMVESVLKELGKIDILVNNAGGSARERSSTFSKSTEDVWDYVFELNLKGVFICSRSVIDHMIQRQSGKIINIASCAGIVGDAGLVDYSAAKSGVIGFTKALAKEVASCGITVNCVAPGPIETRAMNTLSDKVKLFIEMTGMGRMGKPEEVAALVAFLSADEANFISGQVFPVCGLRNIGL